MPDTTNDMLGIVSKLIDTNSTLVAQNKELVEKLSERPANASTGSLNTTELASKISTSIITALKTLIDSNQKLTDEVINELGISIGEQIAKSTSEIKEQLSSESSNISSEVSTSFSNCTNTVVNTLKELTVDTTETLDE